MFYSLNKFRLKTVKSRWHMKDNLLI